METQHFLHFRIQSEKGKKRKHRLYLIEIIHCTHNKRAKTADQRHSTAQHSTPWPLSDPLHDHQPITTVTVPLSWSIIIIISIITAAALPSSAAIKFTNTICTCAPIRSPPPPPPRYLNSSPSPAGGRGSGLGGAMACTPRRPHLCVCALPAPDPVVRREACRAAVPG